MRARSGVTNLHNLFERLPVMATVEQIEALLTWDVSPADYQKQLYQSSGSREFYL